MFRMILSIIILSLITILLFIGTGSGKTITVDDDGEADYSIIQDAIDNASKGDTIRVFEGVYNENIIINKSLSIVGNGSKVTEINDANNKSVVMITTDWVNITGFLITDKDNSKGNYGIEVKSNFNKIFFK